MARGLYEAASSEDKVSENSEEHPRTHISVCPTDTSGDRSGDASGALEPAGLSRGTLNRMMTSTDGAHACEVFEHKYGDMTVCSEREVLTSAEVASLGEEMTECIRREDQESHVRRAELPPGDMRRFVVENTSEKLPANADGWVVGVVAGRNAGYTYTFGEYTVRSQCPRMYKSELIRRVAEMDAIKRRAMTASSWDFNIRPRAV